MADIEFAKGFFYFEPHKNAPDFVLGDISIRPDDFIGWLKSQREDDKGFVKLVVKVAKSGKPYVALNDYKRPDDRGRDDSRRDSRDEEPRRGRW